MRPPTAYPAARLRRRSAHGSRPRSGSIRSRPYAQLSTAPQGAAAAAPVGPAQTASVGATAPLTLMELISAIHEVSENDREAVAAISSLLRRGVARRAQPPRGAAPVLSIFG